MTKNGKGSKEAEVPEKSNRVCDVFEQGCMYCANKPPSVFNPGNYPQKLHVAEMAYQSPQGTLYVRETTAEVEEKPGDDYMPPAEKKKLAPEEPEVIPQEPIVVGNFKGLKQVCSGITFIGEKEDREREAIYIERVTKKLEERQLWKAFVKHMDGFKKLEKIKIMAPPWVQELSTKQITQAERLPVILKQDTDEKSTTNIRKFLNDIGIFPMPGARLIENVINDSERDPLYFLARMQKEVAWLDGKKSAPVSDITDYQVRNRKYSVSEKILLSIIAHLHMPILVLKLHLILPPPALGKNFNIFDPIPEPDEIPEPKEDWFKPDISEKEYDSMLSEFQTLGLNDENAKINKELKDTSSLWTVTSGPAPIRERKSKYLNLDDKTKDLKVTTTNEKGTATTKKSEEGKSIGEDVTDPSNYPSFQSFYQEVETSESTYLLMESFTQTNVSFHENNVVFRSQSKADPYDAETEKIEEEITEVLPYAKELKTEKVVTKHESAQTDPQWLPAHAATEIVELFGQKYAQDSLRRVTLEKIPGINEFGELEDAIVNLIASIIRRPTEYEVLRKQMLKDCLEKYNIDGLYTIFGINKPHNDIGTLKAAKKRKSNKSKVKEIHLHKEQSGKQSSVEKLNTDLEKLISKIRTEVGKQSVDLQLRFALKILSLAGDPLACFPSLHCHPVLMRWYELRIGINRKLPLKEKEKLILKSKHLWTSLLSSVHDKRPHVTTRLTPNQLAQFTWDRRLWVKNKAEKVREQFHHELRQSLVEDAQQLFPTMFTRYYNSKLNKNLREVFFTYLPAKENDYYVFKPWKPEAKK